MADRAQKGVRHNSNTRAASCQNAALQTEKDWDAIRERASTATKQLDQR